MSDSQQKYHSLISGSEVKGTITLDEFPLNFTLMFHAGVSGILFVSIWFVFHWSLWTSYNISTFVVVMVLFGLMSWFSPQFANNISSGKLTFRKPKKDFDWLYYARLRMTILIVVFCLNGSLLIWATGGLASPFIPFYIMVFTLALNYCKFPQPATSLTFSFVGLFFIFILLAEIPWVHGYISAPIDDKTQASINSFYAKKFFDGGFVLASMLVPLISMFLASRRTAGDGAPNADANVVTANESSQSSS